MILWPTQIRRACLCPRLMVDEYKNKRKRWVHSGGMILPGSFFHDHVARPMFEAVAKGNNPEVVRLTEEHRGSAESLTAALWRYLDQKYLTPPLRKAIKSKKLMGDNVIVLAEGLGALSEILAEMICLQSDQYGSAADLLKSVFMPPEKLIKKSITTESGIKFHIHGKYDALLFDSRNQEFVIIEFKCKGQQELVGDVEQVASYAWMISETSGIPARALILYFGDFPGIQRISSRELAGAFGVSMRLLDEIGRWLQAPDLAKAEIPSTTMEGLCGVCPLDKQCERTYGSREANVGIHLRGRLEQARERPAETMGTLLGYSLESESRPIYWNPIDGRPRLANSHMLIVGTSGSGKTQVLKSLISDMIEKRIVVLAFDFNNDYVAEEFLNRHGIKTYEPTDGLPLNPLELVPDPVSGKVHVANGIFATAGILKRIYGLGAQQEANLRTAMEECYKEYGITKETEQISFDGYPSFEELELKIRELPNHIPLLNRLSPIFSLNLFKSLGGDRGFSDFVKYPTVLRLAPLPTEEVKLAVAEFVLLKLYNYFMSQPHRISPVMAIVVDEAHKMSSSEAIVRLFREIRKFGVAMILSSQKARDFDRDIHANAASVLFLKNSEIADRKYIADQLKASDKQKEEIVNLLGFQSTFEGLFRNDHYMPFVRVRNIPYFERPQSRIHF